MAHHYLREISIESAENGYVIQSRYESGPKMDYQEPDRNVFLNLAAAMKFLVGELPRLGKTVKASGNGENMKGILAQQTANGRLWKG